MIKMAEDSTWKSLMYLATIGFILMGVVVLIMLLHGQNRLFNIIAPMVGAGAISMGGE